MSSNNSNNAASLMSSLVGDPDDNKSGDGEQDLFGDIPIDDSPAPVPTVSVPANDSNNINNDSDNNNAGSESIYHDPMSNSTMQQTQQQQTQQQNFQYPQPPQPQQQMAPNITYAESSSNAPPSLQNNAPNPMSQSQPTPVTSDPPQAAPTSTTSNMSKSLLFNSGLLGDNNDEKKAENTGGGDGLFDDIDQEEERKAKEAEAEKKRQEEESAKAAQQQKQEEERMRQQQEEQQRQMQLQQQQQQQQQQMQQSNMQNQQPYSLEARMQGMHLNNQVQAPQGQQNSHMQQPQPQQQMMMNQQQPQQQQMMMNQQGQPMNQSQMNPPGQPYQQGQQSMNQSQMINQSQMNQPPNQQQQQQQPPPSQINVPGGVMYREHSPGMDPNANNNNNAVGGSSYQQRAASMMASSQQIVQQQQPPQQPPSGGYYPQGSPMHQQQLQQPGSPYSPGMQQPHHQMQQQPQQRVQPAQHVPITKPPDVPTYYGKVTVNDPMLLQAPSKFLGMVGSPPYWSYQITTQILGQPPSVWIVRRRFNNVVALEDRLRHECPGAILPPRPDKHVSRAIEEASTHQSAEFAWQRAAELEKYLNLLVVHPEVFPSESLKMFLGLQDDMGTAWPECSANAFTRVSTMGASAAAKVAETGTSGLFGTGAPANTTAGSASGGFSSVMGQVASSVGVGDLVEHVTEDSAELLALSSSESVRMGAVLQAVPKLEGAVTLLREQGEGAGAVGMELNRLAKEVLSQGDRELATPLEIFSNGLLRHGRRTKRLGQELQQATISAFQMQYKVCRYEKMAWADRRNALSKRLKERSKADKRAQQLYHHQQQYPQYGGGYGGGYGQQPQFNGQGNMNQLMTHATMSDNMAVDAVRECDAIGERLKREVNRVSFSRRMDWSKNIKVIASYMKEAASERLAIWESTRDSFLQAFPEYHEDNGQWTNAEPNYGYSSQFMASSQPQQMPQQQMNMGSMNQSYMNQSYMSPGPMPQNLQQQQQMEGSMMGSVMAGATPVGGGYPQN